MLGKSSPDFSRTSCEGKKEYRRYHSTVRLDIGATQECAWVGASARPRGEALAGTCALDVHFLSSIQLTVFDRERR